MEWKRKLAAKGIFYDERIRPAAIPYALYPPHVEDLRLSMLDFSCPIIGCHHHDDRASGSFQRDIPGTSQYHETDLFTVEARRIQMKASDIKSGGYREIAWQHLFRDLFFEPLVETTSVKRNVSRRLSRCSYYYDGFKLESNETWNLFDGRPEDDTSALLDFQRERCPVPDHACFLPMYRLDTISNFPRVNEATARQWQQAPNPALVESFSWDLLKDLSSHGLRPTPFKIFHSQPMEANLKCYPWLVVEHKKEDSRPVEALSCQAANASACAVQLNQIAAKYAVELDEDAQVPPIPAVTTDGPRVKVWITYAATNFMAHSPSNPWSYSFTWKKFPKGYLMRPIWEGEMDKIDDVIKFRLILENTHTWAMRVFKPTISSYIGLWRLVHCRAGIDAGTALLNRRQEVMERCQEVVPMVQSYLNHPTIELLDVQHPPLTPMLLGLLVQQMLAKERETLLEGVDRIVSERFNTLTMNQVAQPKMEISPGENRSPEPSIGTDHQSPPNPDVVIDKDNSKERDHVEPQVSDLSPAPNSDGGSLEETSHPEPSADPNPQEVPQSCPSAKSSPSPSPEERNLESPEKNMSGTPPLRELSFQSNSAVVEVAPATDSPAASVQIDLPTEQPTESQASPKPPLLSDSEPESPKMAEAGPTPGQFFFTFRSGSSSLFGKPPQRHQSPVIDWKKPDSSHFTLNPWSPPKSDNPASNSRPSSRLSNIPASDDGTGNKHPTPDNTDGTGDNTDTKVLIDLRKDSPETQGHVPPTVQSPSPCHETQTPDLGEDITQERQDQV